MSVENENPDAGLIKQAPASNVDHSADLHGSPRRRRQRARRRFDELTPASIVDVTEVVELTTLSRATIYRKMKAGTFPSNRQLNANRSGWRFADVQAWLENLR